MKRALITGGSGFVGRHLARRLTASGVELHAVVRARSDTTALPPEARLHGYGGAPAELADIVDAARPDVTFHLASHFRAEHEPQDLEPLIASNVAFGTYLADALCRHPPARLVNCGTAWQHFGDRDYDPVCLYAATKQAFEAVLEYYVAARGLRVTTLKLFDSYGPDDPRGKLVGALMQAAASGRPLELSPGEQRIDLVHVDDLVRAFEIAAGRLADDEPRSEAFALSSGRTVTLRELVSLVEAVSGRPVGANWGARPYRAREVMLPWSRGRPLPGWQPEIGLEDGLRTLWNAEHV